MFEPSGDLITQRRLGVQRWPIQLDPDRGVVQIGPPRRLAFPPSIAGSPRTGRAGSWPWPTTATPMS